MKLTIFGYGSKHNSIIVKWNRYKCRIMKNLDCFACDQNLISGVLLWWARVAMKISPKTVVWVANREILLVDSPGVLTVINLGIIALVNSTGSVIWSPNVIGSTQDPVAQLMESGNFVVKDANDTSEHFLWQSFDYPCNTLLPGMKLGKNFVKGLERHLSSWKSSDDPTPVLQVVLNGKKRKIVAVTLAFLIGLLLLGNLMHNSKQGHTDKSQTEDLEFPLFDLAVIVNSTNNFSINNKLGEGGFRSVYKGILEGGQEIAVKRLSKNSSQGLDEFKNEVICIAKLQHRNLVKLLGCCIQGEETIGYMSSEYAIDGLFSIKSYVFSFGVLVLEIVSGKKNRGFYHPGHSLNLLRHVNVLRLEAWRLYEDGKSLELIDEALWDLCYQTEMLRSIHVGLLCVHDSLEDRPSMSSIVLMLCSEAALP
ncbi:hypothetical protein TEA_005769 [Camellia sinensis var. sinensis]|uniref:non-specific serine/threonine protein kinase n=1 Tax=Camellia sinensis var. sinensis TaxID=542762 RepID=A0A4V3WPA6_CAMSN|nr:hypothetical protein TEA_005769 [Camellia sinensis var. sinensis]